MMLFPVGSQSSFAAQMTDIRDLGTTLIVILHQPSTEIFQMFDELTLLAMGKCKSYSFHPKSE